MPDAGDEVVSADITDLEDLTIRQPIGRLVQAVAQTGIANNTMTELTFTTEDVDTETYHSTTVTTGRVIPTRSGWFRVNGTVCVSGQTDYLTVEAAILFNGSAIAPATRFTPSASSQTLLLPVQALVSINGSGDYFGVGMRAQRSGAGNSATAVSAQFASVLEWEYVREV